MYDFSGDIKISILHKRMNLNNSPYLVQGNDLKCLMWSYVKLKADHIFARLDEWWFMKKNCSKICNCFKFRFLINHNFPSLFNDFNTISNSKRSYYCNVCMFTECNLTAQISNYFSNAFCPKHWSTEIFLNTFMCSFIFKKNSV